MREIMPEVCWMALYVSILTDKTPERAIDSLVKDPQHYAVGKAVTVEELIELKKNHTYDEIGQMFYLTKDTVYRRIKRYKEREQMTYSYYCENCREEPLSLKPEHRCGKCGEQVIRMPNPVKHVVSNDCKGPEIRIKKN
jgi:uncharacterized metal-binding protein